MALTCGLQGIGSLTFLFSGSFPNTRDGIWTGSATAEDDLPLSMDGTVVSETYQNF